MPDRHVQEQFVETLSALNCSNGMVRMFFVGQDMEKLAEGRQEEMPNPELRQCVTMPLAGFLYAASVVKNFLEDEKFQELLRQYQKAGLLPPDEAEGEVRAAE